MDEITEPSRRLFIRRAVLYGGAALAAGPCANGVLAQPKVSKESMKYQDEPNGDKQCSGCLQFVAPNACKVVEGTISPQGYCLAWARK